MLCHTLKVSTDESLRITLCSHLSLGPWHNRIARERVASLITGQTWRLDGVKARALDELVAAAELALVH